MAQQDNPGYIKEDNIEVTINRNLKLTAENLVSAIRYYLCYVFDVEFSAGKS